MYRKSIKDVLKDLDTTKDGLSSSQVNKRLAQYGENKIENKNRRTKFKVLLSQFDNMMIKLLLIVSVISFIYEMVSHEPFTDTILIIIIIFINVIMGYLQESRAEAQIESLQKFETLNCKVKRNGKDVIVDAVDLVPGDIVYLEAGNKIPADGRIIDFSNLSVNESILTGESQAVYKNNLVIKDEVLINDRHNMLYSGCDITNGHCTYVITETGLETELGKIAEELTNEKDVPTPLQRKIEEISNRLTQIVLVIIAFVFIYNIVVLHNDLMQVIMLAISLLISAVPEGLPAVITVSLSIGVNAMSKKNTIVRTMSSVETLGNVEVICSDKTGTITQNVMTVTQLFSNGKLLPSGKFKYDKDDLMLLNMMLCNDSAYIGDKLIGDPTETALIDICVKNKINYKDIISTYNRTGDIPFDSDRKMMSVQVSNGKTTYLFTKGSLEGILKSCSSYVVDGKVLKLTKEKIKEFTKMEQDLSHKALRVIAFAYKEDAELSEDKLIFQGMVGMIDPPRDSVYGAILTCKSAGITPIMITGDNLITAMEIAKTVGLADEDSLGIEGKDLQNFSDVELADKVLNYSVFARVSPQDKVRIVEAIQKNKKVVAMTGDGVNDAPSIKLADIGIGMGQTGTEVTKSTADILLLDDCFSTIVDANFEGRRIFDNIRNVIVYSLSSNFAEMFIVVIGMFLSVTALLPIHILYIDLVTDAALAICLAFEKASKDVMKRPPRKSTSSFFTPFIIANLGISSVIEAILVLICFLVGRNYGLEIAQTMALLCLIVQETLYAINCRNLKDPIVKQGFFSNKYLNIGMIFIIIVQVLTFITPVGGLLKISPLTFNQVMFIFIINIVVFLIIEGIKPFIRKVFVDE